MFHNDLRVGISKLCFRLCVREGYKVFCLPCDCNPMSKVCIAGAPGMIF